MHTLQVILSEVFYPAWRDECDCAHQSTPEAKAWVAASWSGHRVKEEKNELESSIELVMDRRLKKSHVLCVAPRTSKKADGSPRPPGFKDLKIEFGGCARSARYLLLLDNKDTLGGEGGSCAKSRSTQRSFEIEILLLPSLPSFVIF